MTRWVDCVVRYMFDLEGREIKLRPAIVGDRGSRIKIKRGCTEIAYVNFICVF